MSRIKKELQSPFGIVRVVFFILVCALLISAITMIASTQVRKIRSSKTSDYEIVTSKSNPRFFDYIENFKNVWPDETRVDFEQSYRQYSDEVILFYGLNPRSHVSDIQLYFSHCDFGQDLSFDDMVKLTFSYMNSEVLFMNYTFYESYILRGTDNNKGASTSYNLVFNIRDEAIGTEFWENCAASYIKFSFAFNPNGDISARIHNRDKRINLQLSGLIKEPWNFDYKKYIQ